MIADVFLIARTSLETKPFLWSALPITVAFLNKLSGNGITWLPSNLSGRVKILKMY